MVLEVQKFLLSVSNNFLPDPHRDWGNFLNKDNAEEQLPLVIREMGDEAQSLSLFTIISHFSQQPCSQTQNKHWAKTIPQCVHTHLAKSLQILLPETALWIGLYHIVTRRSKLQPQMLMYLHVKP